MLATQTTIDALATRIERAYRLRRPHWHGGCSSARVWSAAAWVLWQVHENDPVVPPDPELFVAAQPNDSPYPDPWGELTREDSARRYRQRVRSIVRALRAELAREVRHAEELIDAGQAIATVLRSSRTRLSPLGRFIVAHRAGRTTLARRYARDAAEQHRACPLYREASRRLLPPAAYPISENDGATTALTTTVPRARGPVHHN
ncbi:MAG: hypothetical protein U0794_20340 [Isosphaeraceae bacterium]